MSFPWRFFLRWLRARFPRRMFHVPALEQLEQLEQLERLQRSLDRVCSACLAANSQETWDLLHRGWACPTRAS